MSAPGGNLGRDRSTVPPPHYPPDVASYLEAHVLRATYPQIRAHYRQHWPKRSAAADVYAYIATLPAIVRAARSAARLAEHQPLKRGDRVVIVTAELRWYEGRSGMVSSTGPDPSTGRPGAVVIVDGVTADPGDPASGWPVWFSADELVLEPTTEAAS